MGRLGLHVLYVNVQLCGAMRGLAELWWWSPADNNAELHKFHRSEPKQKMKVLTVCVWHGSPASAFCYSATACCLLANTPHSFYNTSQVVQSL